MNYIISASSDTGIKKKTNQDSLSVKVATSQNGKIAFAVLCDGMGGLEKGELASAELVKAFSLWLTEEFSGSCSTENDFDAVKMQWTRIVQAQNNKISTYGKRLSINLGTTVAALLLTDYGYLAMNVGDSRVYEISNGVKQITKDQTVVAREIELGKLTPEQARTDPRRNVLLQCVGVSESVTPAFYRGENLPGTVFMLCSDGFVHEISNDEIYFSLNPHTLQDKNTMKNNVDALIELNKARMERDNISVITIRTV